MLLCREVCKPEEVIGPNVVDNFPLSGGVVHSNVSTRLQYRDCVLTGHRGS